MSEPVGNTCPTIDKVIEAIREAYDAATNSLNDFDEPNINDFQSAFMCIKNSLYQLDYLLEDIRNANHKLRDWGNDLESELDDVTRERDSLQNEVDQLELELESASDDHKTEKTELEDRIDSLEKELAQLERTCRTQEIELKDYSILISNLESDYQS